MKYLCACTMRSFRLRFLTMQILNSREPHRVIVVPFFLIIHSKEFNVYLKVKTTAATSVNIFLQQIFVLAIVGEGHLATISVKLVNVLAPRL